MLLVKEFPKLPHNQEVSLAYFDSSDNLIHIFVKEGHAVIEYCWDGQDSTLFKSVKAYPSTEIAPK